LEWASCEVLATYTAERQVKTEVASQLVHKAVIITIIKYYRFFGEQRLPLTLKLVTAQLILHPTNLPEISIAGN
jgi:hypothetical protein